MDAINPIPPASSFGSIPNTTAEAATCVECAVVAVFDDRDTAETAVDALRQGGFGGEDVGFALRGAPANRLGRITVTGSKSGRHSGRLRAHSDGQGGGFVVKRQLREGEGVTVRTALPIRGTRSGDYTFLTARMPKRVTLQNLILENIPAKRTQHFRSRPDLAPPFVTVNINRPGQAPGDLFRGPAFVCFDLANHRGSHTDTASQIRLGHIECAAVALEPHAERAFFHSNTGFGSRACSLATQPLYSMCHDLLSRLL